MWSEDSGFKRASIPLKNKLSIPNTDYKTDAKILVQPRPVDE